MLIIGVRNGIMSADSEPIGFKRARNILDIEPWLGWIWLYAWKSFD